MTNKVCLVIGAGDATGGAVAKRFARDGFAVCATRRTVEKIEPLIASIRSDGGVAYGFGSDARDEDQVVSLIANIEDNIGPHRGIGFQCRRKLTL